MRETALFRHLSDAGRRFVAWYQESVRLGAVARARDACSYKMTLFETKGGER